VFLFIISITFYLSTDRSNTVQ